MSTIIGRVIPFPKEGAEPQKGFMNPPVEEKAEKADAEKAPTKRVRRGAKSETK